MVVDSVSMLLAGFGSGVRPTSGARLASVVPFGVALLTFTTNVNVAVAPGRSDGVVAVTVPVAPTAGVVNVKTGPVFCSIETNVVLGGRVSNNPRVRPSEGPALVTVSV